MSAHAAVTVLNDGERYVLPAGMALWYDATEIGGVERLLTSWNDKSGNNKTLSPGAASPGPTYYPAHSAMNGRPTVGFNGSNSMLRAGTVYTQPRTEFIVAAYTTSATSYLKDSTVTTSAARIGRAATGYLIAANTIGYSPIKAQYAIDRVNPICFAVVFNTTASYGFVNNIKGPTVSIGVQSMSGLTLGRQTAAATQPSYISEYIMYSRILSDNDILKVYRILKTKWGL